MGGTTVIPGEAIVLRRPHFKLVGDDLFFLISSRPHVRLSPSEAAIWNALDRERSVDELRTRFPEQADPAVQRFLAAAVCELASSRYPEARRRVIVVEPHSDDAALSVGGTMWLQRNECEFIVVTIASRSNFTSYYDLDRDFFRVDEVSALRNAEAALFVRLIGGQHLRLDQPEATLRYHGGDWSLDWYRRHRGSVSAFIGHRSGEAERRVWTDAVRKMLRDVHAEEVWMPLGVGPHTDHELARNACLSALIEDHSLLKDRAVRLYQEVPYAAQFPTYTASLVDTLARAGANLVPEAVPIADVFAEKLHLVSLYASQFKVEVLRPGIEASAREGESGMFERLWRVDRLPEALDPLALHVDAQTLRSAADKLDRWIHQHGQARRMRILLLVPPGRWAEDMDLLLRAFPATRFEVYTAPAGAAEVEEAGSPRIGVHRVGAGPRAWTLLALRLAISRPAPTVFLAGRERLREARLLATLWPMSDPLVLPTMGHLAEALRQISS